MTVKEQLKLELEKLINQVKEQTKDARKIALDQAWKILQVIIAQLVQMMEEIGNELNGPDKKAIVLDLLSGFYDKVFIVIDVPFVPNFLEPIIHRHIKSILMIMVSSSIDATVTIFRQTGVFLKKGTI
jgi:hypothetical protein